jgi:hypothetical protein
VGSIEGDPPNRECFARVGGGSILQAALSFGGVVAFFALTVFVVGQGLPTAIFAVLPGFFGVFLGVGAIAALRRGDTAAIEVGGDGIWLPGLGERRWADFRDIRIEHATGPADGSGTATYRRLGFVPFDSRAAEQRPFIERLTFDMGAGFYRFTSTLAGMRPVDFAPFGVGEAEIGREAFERLLVAVGGHAPIRQLGERPAGVIEPGPVHPPGYVPRGLSGMILPASGAAALGFVGVAIVRFVGPGDRGSAGVAPAAMVFLAVFVLAFAIPVVVNARRARATGVAIVPLVVVLLLAGVAGAAVASAMPFGLR